MPRTQPIIILLELHSFTSASETAKQLILEGWCNTVGFELPHTCSLTDIKTFYQKKVENSGFKEEQAALDAFRQAMQKGCIVNAEEIIAIRNYFSGKARLSLLHCAEMYHAKTLGLDITMEDRRQLCQPFCCARINQFFMIQPRDEKILQSIVDLSEIPAVCIIGVGHGQAIIQILRKKNIPYIACCVIDSWVEP